MWEAGASRRFGGPNQWAPDRLKQVVEQALDAEAKLEMSSKRESFLLIFVLNKS